MKQAQRKTMSIAFVRTGERRYSVRAVVDGGQTVQMDQMPHDLQHFIVEKCLRIEGGIFGRLAAGGTAKTFHAVADGEHNAREASRIRRKQAARDKRLMPSREEDYMRSERATYVCWHDWLAHSPDPELRARAVQMKQAASGMLGRMMPNERAQLTEPKLAAIRQEFQRLSERWASLAVGESFSERW
jgi:hypothetical protein